MDTKDTVLAKYNISESLFKSAEISWDDLCKIYEDFQGKKYDFYDSIRREFIEKYLENASREYKKATGKELKIHSIRSRVKDAEHLVVKIIRKKQENQKKYRKLDTKNYEKFLTDLIGIRCLVLFKDDWENLHEYILSQFENNVEYYIKDPIVDFDDNDEHYYLAEAPKVHIRNGDARKAYEKVFPPHCVKDNKIYRSIHYIVKYRGVYLEIQVRTLFEEGWGEIDHEIVYPYHQNDVMLNEYTELLNRLTGLADEMSVFFKKLQAPVGIPSPINCQDIEIETGLINEKNGNEIDIVYEVDSADTPKGCVDVVMKE